jgi:hypothetical protein
VSRQKSGDGRWAAGGGGWRRAANGERTVVRVDRLGVRLLAVVAKALRQWGAATQQKVDARNAELYSTTLGSKSIWQCN